MKIFITGGAGFICRHLVESFLKSDYHVTIYDNFKNSSEKQISNLVNRGAKVIRGDVTDYESILKAISGHDLVIHLAAEIDVQESINNPTFVNKVNVEGTVNLLKACVRENVKNIIAASSAAVYGEAKKLPILEDSFTKPLSPYGESKLSMENHLKEYSHSNDLNCIIFRFFNVYGAGQSIPYAGVITKFKENIEKDVVLKIFGDGNNTRDFIAIEDVINSFHLAIDKLEGKKGTIYNIATSERISINDLAKMMISISEKKLQIEHTKPLVGEIKHSQASFSRAQTDLGFFPKVALREGLKRLFK